MSELTNRGFDDRDGALGFVLDRMVDRVPGAPWVRVEGFEDDSDLQGQSGHSVREGWLRGDSSVHKEHTGNPRARRRHASC
ncbi:MAG: hypothetical protein JRJ58_15170 [Deltaproteobacteria bacterium]|nr:hypothetical protein [Deltaproteobacteria bacterium]